jgi:hypothetical protein
VGDGAESRCRCGRGEPSPGADVGTGAGSAIPVQTGADRCGPAAERVRIEVPTFGANFIDGPCTSAYTSGCSSGGASTPVSTVNIVGTAEHPTVTATSQLPEGPYRPTAIAYT